MSSLRPTAATERYDEAYIQNLFDRMGPTYDVVNLVSSFGFSAWWRAECVRMAGVNPGARVCDMMSGAGECAPYIFQKGGSVVSVDFSRVMCDRQRQQHAKRQRAVDVRHENALHTSIESGSIDVVVAAFGLKTLDREAALGFAAEIYRILKPGGRFSLLEISTADGWILGPLFRWYVNSAIPIIGRILLGDIECYRMLGHYTTAFGSCHQFVGLFASAGLDVSVHTHFFGCATSLVGTKRG